MVGPNCCINHWPVQVCAHIGPTEVLRSNAETEVFKVNLSIFYYLEVLSYRPHTFRFIFFERLFFFYLGFLVISCHPVKCPVSVRSSGVMSLMAASVVLMKLI